MNIRNICIISHVDHGKSTLADRLLEITGTVPKDKMKPQLLDSLALERERGITIKLAPVRMNYTLNTIPYVSEGKESSAYILNLIDTPGHVDFSYEVSRSLAAVEGAILLVDSTQGIQAQTLAHGLSALEQNLALIPVINKIDLPNADINGCKKQLIDTFGFSEDEIILASGKTGQGVEEILKAVIEKVPQPKLEVDKKLKALVFDLFFDAYKGVVAQVRIIEGQTPSKQSKIVFLGTKATGEILEIGYFTPQLTPTESLEAGEIGYVATGIKRADLVSVGDTISTDFNVESLPGYKSVKPMVFVGLYPIEVGDYFELKEALAKFKLTDPAFDYTPEQSSALGAGFRCGFLGLLHAEVVQERLSSEFGVNLIATAPSVEYMVGDSLIHNPVDIDPSTLRQDFDGELSRTAQGSGQALKNLKEPWIKMSIFTPQEYIGRVLDLVQERRGKFINLQHYGAQVELLYEMPLSEMITDFYDKLKSISSGYASLDYQFLEFREVDALKLDFLVAGERVDALSSIVHRLKSESVGRRMVEKLKGVLPRQNFAISIQAAINGHIIARETIPAYRKDVTAKLYGGDRTRKDKLLKKQKKGKKKMKMIGKVEIPQEAFLSILKS